jgi:hypothetical protein
MTPGARCGMAGPQCPNDALAVVRIYGVGDRNLCQSCLASITRLGMDFRRLDAEAVVPEWRQRLTAVDMTGRVLA